MSVAALREELQREQVVWALGSMRPVKDWERWGLAKAALEAHLPPGTPMRLPLGLMPDWYRQTFADPTQIDGRVALIEANSAVVTVITATHWNGGTRYSVESVAFLDAVLAGQVGDAS